MVSGALNFISKHLNYILDGIFYVNCNSMPFISIEGHLKYIPLCLYSIDSCVQWLFLQILTLSVVLHPTIHK